MKKLFPIRWIKPLWLKLERTFMQQEFHKIMKNIKKYKVHDEKEQAKVGDIVRIL